MEVLNHYIAHLKQILHRILTTLEFKYKLKKKKRKKKEESKDYQPIWEASPVGDGQEERSPGSWVGAEGGYDSLQWWQNTSLDKD